MISDEVVTGFGRLGSMFGARHWGVKPDVMVFAKGINSGYVPLGATLMNQRVADAYLSEDEDEFTMAAFWHGNTYAGHPLACVAAMANLKIVEDERLDRNAAEVGAHFLQRLKQVQDRHEMIGDVRGLGLMLGVELVADRRTKQAFDLKQRVGARIADLCREDGVLIRNLADTFVISPPLILDRSQVDQIVDAFDRAIGVVERA